MINGFIVASRQWCENETHRAIPTQTIRVAFDGFPGSSGDIILPKPRLVSVTTVQYIDSDGVTQSLTETTDFVIDKYSEPGIIYPAYNTTWPTTRNVQNALTVTYVAGYGAAGVDVPQGIKQAMFLIFGHWYENREEVIVGTISSEIANAAKALLMQYKVEAVR